MAEGLLMRRRFLRQSLQYAAGSLVLSLSGGCGKGRDTTAATPGCDDIAGLSTSERSFRQSLGYVDNSPHGDEKNCNNCYFFTAADTDICGKCNTVKGPINPYGYCAAWTGAAS